MSRAWQRHESVTPHESLRAPRESSYLTVASKLKMGPVTFLLERKRRVASISLFVLIITAVLLLMSSSIGELLARVTEAPFVYTLHNLEDQFGNVAHSFVIKGYPGYSYEVATFLDLCWAFARLVKADLLFRLLTLPLAYFHFRMFYCVATAESRIRRLKGKKVRWEEYLRLYLPISIKAGFFTALASISAAAIFSESLALPAWLLYPLVLVLQLSYFAAGLYSALAFTSVVMLLAYAWGFYAQPVRLPFFTSFLPVILALAQLSRWAAEPLARNRESRVHQQAVQFIVSCNKVEERLLWVGEHVVKRVDSATAGLQAMAQRVLDRLPKVKLTFTNDDSRAAAGADTITPPPSTSTSQESSEVPSKEKKQLATAPATSDSFSKQKLAPSPVLKPVSAVVPVASSTPGHPWGLCFLACSLLTALFASDLYTAKPVGHILRFGEMMRVGDRRQYRCNLRDWLTSSRCKSLDFELASDGTLRLYEHAHSPSEERRLLWASNTDPALEQGDRYAAQLDEKARLVVSLDDKVVYRTPRLVGVVAPESSPAAATPELSLDGHMGGFYITTSPVEPSASEVVPTFASTW